jgi:formylglycine-generating enzyme required for sulfatase activity
VENEGGGPLRSAIALTVGSAPATELTASEKRAWRTTLSAWYQKHPDTGTHSAAGWALRRWNLELPTIAITKQPSENRDWHLNSIGMTMLELPAGSFVHKGEIGGETIEHPVTLPHAFLLADAEVTRAQYQQFIDDPQCPSDEKPTNWNGAIIRCSPTEQHPVQNVSWYEAILFCNWLSRLEGLTPCYQRTGQTEKIGKGEVDVRKLVPDARGYRLPTEAEWEYACRAGTETSYYFGEDKSWLDRYAVHRASQTELPGTKLPNAWGLFDAHGNLWELCQDWNRAFAGDISYRHPSKITDAHRALRGGSFMHPALNVRSATRFSSLPDSRGNLTGIRVARTHR